MAMRPTSFELHIKTLFTEQDIKAMLDEGIDLLSYDDVKKRSDDIVKRLEDKKRPMPPKPPVGTGPWPEEWIALFKRWVAEGHPV